MASTDANLTDTAAGLGIQSYLPGSASLVEDLDSKIIYVPFQSVIGHESFQPRVYEVLETAFVPTLLLGVSACVGTTQSCLHGWV